jgi:ribonuclease P protein component
VNADASERSREHPAAMADMGVTSSPAGASRAGRLLKHSDFERVYKQGRRHFSSHMTVFYLRQAEGASPDGALLEKSSRVGFTVGKILGGAVDRNRIKRRLREAVRLRRAVLAGICPVDVVINPKKSVLKLEFAVLLDEVGQALDSIARKISGEAGL